MPTNVNYQVPWNPQESTTQAILHAIQLANEMHVQQQQVGIQQQQANTQQQGVQQQAPLIGAQTEHLKAETASGLSGAQAAAANARAALEQAQAALASATNPLDVKMKQIEVDRAEALNKFYGAGASAASGPTAFDQIMASTRTSLGKLNGNEQAQLDAAEHSARLDGMQGRPDAQKHLESAINDISNNRRAFEVAKMYGSFRGDIYNKDYLNTDTGALEQLTANQFLKASKEAPGRYLEYSSTVANAMKAQSQVNDIQDGIANMRAVLKDPKFEFTPTGRTLMAAAAKDPTVLTAAMSGAAAQQLSPAEKDYFQAMNTLVERGMSLRGLQGQGAGSDAQREAIVRLLPSLTTADPAMATKALDLFQNNLDNLNKGIPKIGKQSKTPSGGTPAAQPPATNAGETVIDLRTKK